MRFFLFGALSLFCFDLFFDFVDCTVWANDIVHNFFLFCSAVSSCVISVAFSFHLLVGVDGGKKMSKSPQMIVSI